ncbi:Gigaxonin [Liparis tanakae]|uniref:Gigaxonin n=1 Tax=Liparis tanakae TaxID=230148 RepID=A0A4Z2G502_9TELE|nr:Gigaxonin [Liparis tanakae]
MHPELDSCRLFSLHYCLYHVHYAATEFLQMHFGDVSRTEEFRELPPSRLCELLAMEKLNVGNEKHVLEAVVRWYAHDPVERKAKEMEAEMERDFKLECKEREEKLKEKQAEMERVFDLKVKERKKKLEDAEAEMERHHALIMGNLEAQNQELDEKRRVHKAEEAEWEAQKKLDEERRVLEAKWEAQKELDEKRRVLKAEWEAQKELDEKRRVHKAEEAEWEAQQELDEKRRVLEADVGLMKLRSSHLLGTLMLYEPTDPSLSPAPRMQTGKSWCSFERGIDNRLVSWLKPHYVVFPL